MSNLKHTTGPWELQGPKIQEDFGGQTYWTIIPHPYKSKADPFKAIGFYYPYSGHTKEQQEANAKLIAAAPELLETLTGKEEDPHLYAVNWLATLLRICHKEEVYKAICEDQGGDFDAVNTMLIELETLVKTGNEAIKKATE